MRVTVMVPAKDRWPLLQRCLNSLVLQSEPAKILVFDDGSSEPISWVGDGVEIHRVEESVGQCSARNYWVDKVDTPYLKWVDSDDFMEDRGSLERQVDFLQGRPDLDFCWDSCDYLNYRSGRIWRSVPAEGKDASMLALPDEFVKGFSRRRSEAAVQVGTALFRSDSVRSIPWDEAYKGGGADLRFFSDVSKAGLQGETTGNIGLVHVVGSPSPDTGGRYG